MLEILIVPFINALIFLYSIIGENYGLAIIIFTVVLRLITYPFTKKQLDSSTQMTDFQSSKEWKSAQKKFKGDKDKLAQEQMRLYKEMGISPFGSCLPSLIPMIVIIPVYFAVVRALATTPMELVQLYHDLSVASFAKLIPLNTEFWFIKDLGQPERWLGLSHLIPSTTPLFVHNLLTFQLDHFTSRSSLLFFSKGI